MEPHILTPEEQRRINKALLDAVHSNNPEEVISLLEQGAKVNYSADNRGYNCPLINAAKNGHTGIARILIEHGADVNLANNYGETALMSAITSGHTDTVKLLVERKADINHIPIVGLPCLSGFTGLMYAILHRYTDMIRLLIEHGADANRATYSGDSALTYAAITKQVDIVKLLLLYNANIPVPFSSRTWGQFLEAYVSRLLFLGYVNGIPFTTIPLPIKNSNINGILKLLEALNISPLSTAIIASDKQAIAQTLDELKQESALLDIQTQDNFGMTALHWAAVRNDGPTVQDLLEHKAKVNIRDNDGKTPIHYAARNGNTLILKVLLTCGANINAQDESNNTALHYAAGNGHLRAVQALLRHNAQVNLFNNQNKSAWILALQHNHPEITDFLKKYAGPAIFGLVQRAGQAGELTNLPGDITLSAEIAVQVAQYAMAPGAPAPSGLST